MTIKPIFHIFLHHLTPQFGRKGQGQMARGEGCKDKCGSEKHTETPSSYYFVAAQIGFYVLSSRYCAPELQFGALHLGPHFTRPRGDSARSYQLREMSFHYCLTKCVYICEKTHHRTLNYI